MEIFAVMHPGMALLVMIGVLMIVLVGLLASGIVKINIEVVDENDEKLMLDEIKELDDSTLKNRIVKWLARMYERCAEKEKMKQNLKDQKGKEENDKD